MFCRTQCFYRVSPIVSKPFLFQNMFPILPKYIDHIHTIQHNPVLVRQQLQTMLDRQYRDIKRLHKRGAKVIFPDVTRLEKLMKDELAADTVKVENKTEIETDNSVDEKKNEMELTTPINIEQA